jgi:hypothetical protein
MLRTPNEPLPGQPITAADVAALARYIKQSTPRKSVGQLRRMGSGGFTTRSIAKTAPPGIPAASAWTFKLYNTTKTTTGQIQVNGDDGLTPTLNGIPATIGGNTNVKTGSPLAWPQLSITGNGYIYAFCTLATTSGVTTLTAVDVQYLGGLQTPLTDATSYAWILLGTINNYATDDSGNVKFDLGNAQSTGLSQFAVCNGGYNVW